MERATNDRFVWTDDDFDRSQEWLDRLILSSQRRGPTTLLPDFVGGGWWLLAEPALLLLFAVRTLVLERRGESEAVPWGGGVAFHRNDLSAGVGALVGSLRACLSDDLMLDEHLTSCRRDPSLHATVRVRGTASAVYHRLLRYMRADHVHRGLHTEFALWTTVAAVAVLFPLPAAVLATTSVATVLVSVGRFRWHVVLAYPALLLLPVIIAAGIMVTDVEWMGRRYRIRAADDVEVVDQNE